MVMFHKRGMRGVEGSDGVRPQSWAGSAGSENVALGVVKETWRTTPADTIA